MKEVVVELDFDVGGTIIIEVDDPEDIDEVREKALDLSALDLNLPDVYESIGMQYKDKARQITEDDIVEVH